MKKTLFVLTVLVIALVGFAGCSNSSSDDNTPTVVPHSDLYGSYWGTCTVGGTQYETCIMLAEKGLAVYSDPKSFSYPQVTYADNGDGTWLVSAYEEGKTPGTDPANVTVTVSKTTEPYTANVAIAAMGTLSCTKGVDYDGRFTKQTDLYGSYWGRASVAGAYHDMCIVVKADGAEVHSDMMGFAYEVVTYENEGNGIWMVGCYHTGDDTTKPSTHVRIRINTKTLPFSCKPNIIPMGAIAQFLNCTKGKPYNNEYTY